MSEAYVGPRRCARPARMEAACDCPQAPTRLPKRTARNPPALLDSQPAASVCATTSDATPSTEMAPLPLKQAAGRSSVQKGHVSHFHSQPTPERS